MLYTTGRYDTPDARLYCSQCRRIVGDEFKSNEAPELDVLGLVDHTHPAATQLLNDSVVRNGLTNHSEISASAQQS